MNVSNISDGLSKMSGYVSYSRTFDTNATLEVSEKYNTKREERKSE